MQQPATTRRAAPIGAQRLFTAALAAAAALCAADAWACAACEHTLSTNWETQGIGTKEGITADVSYTYINQNQQRYGGGAASGAVINRQLAAGQEIEAYTATRILTAAFGYTADTWGINLLLPYVQRTHGTYGNTAPLGSSYSTSSDNGLGDVRLIGRYTGFSEDNNAGLIAGIKLPTGNTNALFNAGTSAGQPLDAGLQLGTGSTDLILGGFYAGTVSSYGWFAQGSAQRAVATRAGLTGAYRPGDTYTVNTGIRYAGFGAKVSPMLQLSITKRQADRGATSVPLDPLTGAPVSGGTLVYLAPGITARVGHSASVYGFVQLPVYQNVNSLQLTPRYTLTLGVRQSF